ncbi:MAG: MFS transporter [Acidobacteria bacterium]|nr:MFS transporter [Acidobacteriota bacterium]
MLTLAAILSIFVYGIIAAMLGTILPDISKRFNLGPKQNGNIAMAQAVGLMIGSFFAGPIMDVQGKKVGLLIGLGLVVVALVGLRAATGYAMVAGLMLLLGTGGGAIVNGANALPPDIQIEGLTTAGVFNLLNLFFGLGGLVTPLIAAKLFRNQSGNLLIFASGLTALTLAVCAMTAMAPPSGQVAFQASLVTDLLGNTKLLLLALMLFLYVACEVGVWNWLVRHLIAQGVSEGKALTILSLGFALGLLIGRVVVSGVLKGVTPEAVLIGSGALMAITTFLMLQSKSDSVAWITVFLAGIAMAPVFPTTLSVVPKYVSAQAAATATGIALTAGWLGLVVSSPIIGSIAGDDPKGLKKALLVLPACSIVMVLVGLTLL